MTLCIALNCLSVRCTNAARELGIGNSFALEIAGQFHGHMIVHFGQTIKMGDFRLPLTGRNDIHRRMSNRIREIRKERGYSLKELAQRVGQNTSFGTTAKLERGDMKLSYDWMLKISSALTVEPAELISDNIEDHDFIKLPIFNDSPATGTMEDAQFDNAIKPHAYCHIVPVGLLNGLESLLAPLMEQCVLDTDDSPMVSGGLYLLRDKAGAYHGRIFRENPARFAP